MRETNGGTESRWGLGLENLADMPNENIKTFGLVSLEHYI